MFNRLVPRIPTHENPEKPDEWLLRHFRRWCQLHKAPALPASPETIALFITEQSNRNRDHKEIIRRLAAIASAHKEAGWENPTTENMVKFSLSNARHKDAAMKAVAAGQR